MMSIRTKLIFSNIAMVIIPVLLFGIMIAFATHTFFKDVLPGISRTESRSAIPFLAIREQFSQRNELTSGLRFIAKHDPELLADSEFLASTEAELHKADSAIVVARSGSIVYSSPGLSDGDILNQAELAAEGKSATSHPGPPSGSRLEIISYTAPDGEPSTLIIVNDMDSTANFFKSFIPLVLLTILGALALTNGILTYLVSRSIIKPLYALQAAAGHIREGELDHPVSLGRQDEIGQLGSAFEDLRIRLKQSLGDHLQLEDARKELLANISHDLKTPITAVQGCAECLLDGSVADTEEKRQKYAQMIIGKTKDMNNMIEELQLYSTLDTGKLPLRFERVDLAAYIDHFVQELRPNPGFDGVDIVFVNAAKRPALIEADKEKLRRVFMNLTENSLHHMKASPKLLEFQLQEEAHNHYIVHVKDNGTGIPEAALPYVFDQFFRAESSRSPGEGGSGLGLAIVKQIAERHGGMVEARSSEGAGTTISLMLPSVKADPNAVSQNNGGLT